MKIFEAFSGYGGWSFGLKLANIPHEVVGYSEVDKYAIQCYEQNHKRRVWEDEDGRQVYNDYDIINYGDITQIDYASLPDFDMLCASPPCQAFSVAGKGQGADDEKGRGRLFEDTIELMRIKQPKYAWYENVKGLVSKKHKEYFESILQLMRDAGYKVQWQVLNTKEHGIPQNRERVFILCIRNDIELDYKFPEKEPLTLFLKDILEPVVDEKYYLKPERVEMLLKNLKQPVSDKQVLSQPLKFLNRNQKTLQGDYSGCVDSSHTNGILQVGVNQIINPLKGITDNGWHFEQQVYSVNGVTRSVKAGSGSGNIPKIVQVNNPTHSNDTVYLPDGLSPALNTMQGGSRQPFIAIKNATSKGYSEAYVGDGVNLEQPNSATKRGRVQLQSSPTLQYNDARAVVTENLLIRKLTPKECFRLQGFLQDQINLDGLSQTQQYKLVGNGVSINVIKKLMENLVR
jgi:DNA (cytosine-5)-methyltransferase 1